MVLVPLLLIMIAAGSIFFGYRPVSIQGSSMEPALCDGDALWVRYLEPAEVTVGDIVILRHATDGLVCHRVGTIERLSDGGYFIVTKGDAIRYTEGWEVAPH